MSWVTIAWSMIAAVCLTLALQHLLLWAKQRGSWADLLFSTTAMATAGIAAAELAMMRATTAEAFNLAVRWYHVPAWVLVVSLAGFVRLYLDAGRLWLAVSAVAMRTLTLGLNFLLTPNLNYQNPVRLRHLRFLGESVSIAEGAMNPWMLAGQLSLLLLVSFVLDATLTCWRRGDQRPAVVVGGSIVGFVAGGGLQALLAVNGIIQMPIMTCVFYLGIAAAMSFKLSEDLLRAVQLDRDLSESQRQLELAAATASVGLWVWDIGHDDLWMTAQGRALFGFTPGTGLNLASFLASIHPEDRPMVESAVQQSLARDGEFDREYRRLLPSGRTQWIAVYGRVECSRDGRPLRLRGVSLDITRRKEAELAVQQHRSELAHLSRVNLLGALSGSLAHELNQPLTAILSDAQAAQRFLDHAVPDLDEVRDILRDIIAEDRRASEVICRLRRLLEKGELRREPLSINEVVHDVLKLLRNDLLNRQIMVQTALTADLPPIYGDRVQLQQVLINLIVNGCDAMLVNPVAQRTLRVSTAQTAECRLKVCVSDQGPGVPAHQQETIFSPFFTTKAHGMGLGLAVCRMIITAHHGELWMEGAADGGARFYFSVPAYSQD